MLTTDSTGCKMLLVPGVPPVFPPVVTTHLIKLACELPEDQGRSLSLWTCAELARALVLAGRVESISAQTVQRLLAEQRLRPWRVHHWLSPRAPRDLAFADRVTARAPERSWRSAGGASGSRNSWTCWS